MTTDQQLGTIHVEVVGRAGAGREALKNLGSGEREFVSADVNALGQVVEIGGDEFAQGLQVIASSIRAAMDKAAPDSWSVELNVGFKAGVKVPILMSGEANAALKVTLNWKRAN